MPWALPLVGLDVLIVVLWTVAAALGIALIMQHLASILDGVPWVGGKLSGATRAMARAITSACGALMQGIEGLVGAGLHLLARYIDKWLSQFVAHASLIAHLAELVGGALYRVSGLKALVHQVAGLVHMVLHRFVTIGRELYHLRRLVRTIEHDVAHGIGEDVLPRIRSLDRRLHNLRRWATREIADAEAQAEAATASLWTWLTGVGSLPLDLTFAGAVAVALRALGLGGLRCNSLISSLKGRGCGLWSGLDDLPGLFIDAVIFVDLCAMLPVLEQIFAELEAPVVDLIAAAADAACAHPSAGWVELAAPPVQPPRLYYAGTVPGN